MLVSGDLIPVHRGTQRRRAYVRQECEPTCRDKGALDRYNLFCYNGGYSWLRGGLKRS